MKFNGQKGQLIYLECKDCVLWIFDQIVSVDECCAFVGEFKERSDVAPDTLEHNPAGSPPYRQDSDRNLKGDPPKDGTPLHLSGIKEKRIKALIALCRNYVTLHGYEM